MDFKVYLKEIGAKAGDKLEFVGYTNYSHSHWMFHIPEECQYKDFRVGTDGYMYSNHRGTIFKHTNNWGFAFKVVKEVAPLFGISFREYFERMGFKDGDELEFEDYATGRHNHWRFEDGNHQFKVVGHNLGMYVDGRLSYEVEKNYDFIFKRKFTDEQLIQIATLKDAIKLIEKQIADI